MKFKQIALLPALFLLNPVLSAEEWRQFRGPNASGLVSAKIADTWSETQNVMWKVDLPGEGWSAPVTTNGKVIVTAAVPQDGSGREAVHQWLVYCFDEATGKELWKQVAIDGKPRLGKHRDNTYASETPVTDGQTIVAYFGMMGVVGYDLDGKQLWKKDLGAFPMQNEWGTSSSPAMHDGRVFLQIDNEQESFLVALDAKTGDEIWRQKRTEGSNWGSAMIWENSLRTELITNGRTVRSYDPKSGDLLWEIDLSENSANATPAGFGDILIVGSGGRRGRSICAVKAGAKGKITPSDNDYCLWKNDSVGAEMSSPLLVDNYVYLLGRRGGQVTVLDIKTGQQVYQDRLPGGSEFWASPWFSNGKIFCPDANGTTYVIEPGPSLKLISENKLPAPEGVRYWSSAGIGGDTVFIRSTSTLYAISAKP